MPAAFAASGPAILASALTIVPGTPASAQEQEQAALEEITVTGSRIRRQDFTANSPIMTIDESLFQETTAIGVETVLNRLPQFIPAVTQFDTGDVQTTATNTVGASTVSLRGLGPNRNLVLIDGRRAMPVNPTMVVDTNSIPAAAIQRVEVISGGASAVYGADAVGGVVNFILKDDFEGAEVDVRFGDTQHGGSQEVTVSALLGAALNDDRGNVMIGVERSTRSKQLLWQRDWRVEDYAHPRVSGTAFFPTETYFTNDVFGTFANLPSQAVVNDMFNEAEACSFGSSFDFSTNPPTPIPNDPNAQGVCPETANGVQLGVPNDTTFYINRTPDGTGTVFTGLGGGSSEAGSYRYTGPFDQDPYGRFQGLPFRKIQPDGSITENSFWNWASTPLERLSSFARGEYDVSDNVRVTSQAMFTRTETQTSLGLTADALTVWGAQVPFGTTLYEPSVDRDFLGNVIGTNADYLPGGRFGLDCEADGVTGCTESEAWPVPPEIEALFMSRADPEADIWVNRPLDFLREALGAARGSENVTTTMQLSLGLEGELPSGDDFWDVTVSTGRTTNDVTLGGAGRLSQWRGLMASPNYGRGFIGDPNPFGDGFAESIPTCESGLPIVEHFTITEDCVKALTATLQNRNEIEQTIFEANLVGDLMEMPAGPLQYAVGTTYRENSYEFTTDNLAQNASFTDSIIGLFPQENSGGEFDVTELYGELLIPIVSDGPTGVEHFTFEVGGRVSEWSTVGNLESYKGLIDWAFTPRYRLRGGFNRAHRAPNLGELFIARTQLLGGVDTVYDDQCSEASVDGPFSANPAVNVNGAEGAAFTKAICQQMMGAAGAAEYYENLEDQPDGVSFFETGVGIGNTIGNPNLREEQADTFTLGLVMDVLENWTVAVDYYTIEITDMIAVESGDSVFERCLSPEFNPAGDASHPDCERMDRNPSTGDASNIDVTYTNQGRAQVSGVDLTLNWTKQMAGGGFNLNMVANYNLESITQDRADQAEIDWAGTNGCALQIQCQGYDYRLFTTLSYFRGPWNLTLRHQFWPSILDETFADENATSNFNNGGVDENYQLVSLTGSYMFADRYTLRVGIENLFDKKPPLAGGNPDATPFPTAPTRRSAFGAGATYDTLGRRGYVSLTMAF